MPLLPTCKYSFSRLTVDLSLHLLDIGILCGLKISSRWNGSQRNKTGRVRANSKNLQGFTFEPSLLLSFSHSSSWGLSDVHHRLSLKTPRSFFKKKGSEVYLVDERQTLTFSSSSVESKLVDGLGHCLRRRRPVYIIMGREHIERIYMQYKAGREHHTNDNNQPQMLGYLKEVGFCGIQPLASPA